MKHLLVVDDDPEIRALLAEYLERNGFRVSTLADGRELARMDPRTVDLVILDVMMPGDDGLTLCRHLRARSRIPVLMLSARGEDIDRIVGLEMGADDYVAKPFHPRELLARVNAIIKRAEYAEPPPEMREYRFESHVLDMVRRTVTLRDGTTRRLGGSDFELLSIFVARPNRVLSRDLLVEMTQGREAPAYDRSIDTRVSRLRQTLGDRDAVIIRTVYGEGYIFSTEVDMTPFAHASRQSAAN
jgi:two-component system OmpR family response regulator